MIYFKTLNNKLVQYKNKFCVKSVREYENPEILHKYFALHAEVAVFIYIGKSTIWAVASSGEEFDNIAPKNYDRLPLQRKIEILDEFDDINEAELATLESYAKSVVIPFLHSCCDQCNTDSDHIIDIRHAFDSACQQMGFITLKK